jgi:hypothetical protein
VAWRLGRVVARDRTDRHPGVALSIAFEFRSFADYWSTFTTGQGKTGGHLMSLSEPKRQEIEQHVRAAYLCGQSDGTRAFTTTFWAVQRCGCTGTLVTSLPL